LAFRNSSVRALRASSADLPAPPPKSVELEVRISRLEILLADMKAALDVALRQNAALKAQLDHLEARVMQL